MQGIQAWDRYAYANNSPLNYTDPSGHFAIAIPLIVIAPVVVTVATYALLTVAAIVTAVLIVEVAEEIGRQFTPPMAGGEEVPSVLAQPAPDSSLDLPFAPPMENTETDITDTFAPPMSSSQGLLPEFTEPLNSEGDYLPQAFELNIDPNKALNQYVPNSIRRKIPSYLHGHSYNKIVSEIRKATGKYLNDLKIAKKVIEQMPRLIDKPKPQ